MRAPELAAALLFAASLASAETPEFETKKLAQSLTWQRLLHYDGTQSDVTDPRFFVSSHGSRDPHAELLAFLEAIQKEDPSQTESKRVTCRFPARFKFVQMKLNIAERPPCPEFEEWSRRARPDKVYFVYAAQFSGNPASAFGHSFLRFDKGFRSGLLGFSLTYSAQMNPDDHFAVYALKGLSGGYLGAYKFDHFYPQEHGYASAENRDLWEYELALSANERSLLFDHAWEMAAAGQTPYYFLDQNCTFQLLRLLEVVNEDFQLSSQAGRLFVTPQESVKILDRAQLILRSSFRPSLKSQAQSFFVQLNDQQKMDHKRVLSGELDPLKLQDPLTASSLVATLAMNEISESHFNVESQSLFSQVAAARARLSVLPDSVHQLQFQSQNGNPLKSHDSMQVSFGAFENRSTPGWLLGFRPALHSLDELGVGYIPYSQLIFFQIQARLKQEDKIEIHDIQFFDIKSFQPRDEISSEASWRFKLAYESSENTLCADCHRLRTTGSFGSATRVHPRVLGYALLGPSLDLITPQKNRGELGLFASAQAGLLLSGFSRLASQLEGQLDQKILGATACEQTAIFNFSLSWQSNRAATWTFWSRAVDHLNLSMPLDRDLGLKLSHSF